MRNKIDYGIDLGTTNSSIARMDNGVLKIIKSERLMDTMPSCVHFTKKKDILVGCPAVDALVMDNVRALDNFEETESNSFIEFKRTMGTTTTYYSSHMDQEFTSEQLSAEVLKKLKSFVTDEKIFDIVITVPAKFLNPQNEATKHAANLAGFKQVHLLQEPVAAATAYGLTSKIKNGYFLVFDFGGGTFDVALLKSEEGILSIKDTEGNNWLGGKNIDEAIVDKIVIPFLRDNYSINSILEDSKKIEILRNAIKPLAEEAKIQLSFKDKQPLLNNLDDLQFIDDEGKKTEIDITLDQKYIEEVSSPYFQQAIDITKNLLIRNFLKGSDLAALILVGGPTYSPILRRMLKEQVTENVDISIDPMTIVAQGAALFASTISVSEETKEKGRDKTKLQLDVKYETTTVEIDEMVNIKLLPEKTEGKLPEKVFVDVVRRRPEGFSSGKKQISEHAILIDIKLEQNCPNEFEIIAYDDTGNKLECQPNKLTMLQGIGGVDSMAVLPYHIGIGKYFRTEDKDLFFPVKGLEKNRPIKSGITGVADNLKTRSDVRPGMKDDIIRIPIYQGEYYAEGTNPDLNYHVKDVIISGETIPKFLPIDSPVNIRIKVDSSSIMTFIAEFPTIEHEEELKIDIKKAEPPSQESLNIKLKQAITTAQNVNRADLQNRLEKLREDINTVGSTRDGRLRLIDEYRKILLELEKADKAAEWPKVEEELKIAFHNLEDLIAKLKENGDDKVFNMVKIEAEIEEYRNTVDKLIIQQPTDKSKIGKELIGKMDDTRVILLIYLIPERFIQNFDRQFGQIHWINPTKARTIINQGLSTATTSYNREQLTDLVFKVYREMRDPNEFNTGTLE